MDCPSCAAPYRPASISKGECEYCGHPVPEVVDAALKAAALRELTADHDGDGVPDALQALDAARDARARREADEAELRSLRQKHALYRKSQVRPKPVAVAAAVIALVLGTIWLFVSGDGLERGPWLGAHADLMCPRVCEGCSGPYRYMTVSTTGTSGSSFTAYVFCRPPDQDLHASTNMELLGRVGSLEPYRLPGGLWHLWLASFVISFLPGLALSWWWVRRTVRARLAAVPRLAAEMRRLESNLQS